MTAYPVCPKRNGHMAGMTAELRETCLKNLTDVPSGRSACLAALAYQKVLYDI